METARLGRKSGCLHWETCSVIQERKEFTSKHWRTPLKQRGFLEIPRDKKHGSLVEIHVYETMNWQTAEEQVRLCANASPILQYSSEGWIITAVWQPAVKHKFAGGWCTLPTWHFRRSARFPSQTLFLSSMMYTAAFILIYPLHLLCCVVCLRTASIR